VYGKADVINNIIEDIQTYLRKQTVEDDKQDSIWALVVRGSMGSGKSLFSRRLILETNLREKQILRPLMAQYNSKYCF
jgi:tRNA A37 threonylcarbamoyladenosine biosynthesis protein TsaE